MAKSVIVAGDLVTQENLVQRPAGAAAHAGALPQTALHRWVSGAGRLASLVRIACSDLDLALAVEESQSDRLASRTYALWTLHEQVAGSRQNVWRIREFLGAAPAQAVAPAAAAAQEESAPDLLVLDDQNLGFRNETARWPAALREGGTPRRIILKTCAPLGEGLLWQRLLGTYPDRLDVVVAASALRARGASISQSLSWDRTIEEIVREFESGVSSADLASVRRAIVHFANSGAASFTRLAPSSSNGAMLDRARLERFLYHPEDQETGWDIRHPGLTIDASGILVASLARLELAPESYPLYIALGRGLNAMRAAHEQGGGAVDNFSLDAADKAIANTLHPPAGQEPAASYYTAFPHSVLGDPVLRAQSASESNLLRDAIGSRVEYVVDKGIDICLRGLETALPAPPKCRYGHFLTADREEMERLNAIRNLIQSYRANLGEKRPLSIAVFGPPGSGKSFAVKELAAELFAGKLSSFEFNLSQFESSDDLHQAFHQIRDGSVHGQVPFVFWDEFDSLNLKWLKEFLAPMQDAVFLSKGTKFPFGKVIFVFAGGTAASLAEFDKGGANAEFRAAKGPDFVSRLRGFIDIKGPNPAPGRSNDLSYIIRRAIMLRSAVSRLSPRLADSRTGMLSVSTHVVRAFLLAGNYIHGARSLESIVGMSDLSAATYFGPANLPSADLLRLHVSPDFQERLHEAQLELPLIESLAAACHEAFCHQREKQGYKWGAVRDDEARTHPLLKPYEQLSEADKERNRGTARLTYAKLSSIGYRIVPAAAEEPGSAILSLPQEQYEALMRAEHDIWLREHLLRGYQWAEKTQDALRLHRDIENYDDLSAEDRALDAVPIHNIVEIMRRHGYVLVKSVEMKGNKPQK